MDQSKKPALYLLARIFGQERVPYAIIGGIAMQVHQEEPRTTLDIDVAVLDRAAIPRTALLAAGFTETGRYPHSENWSGPGATPVQFTDDVLLREPVLQAVEISLEDVSLRVIRPVDLVHAKLRAAADPARRRSKRLQDLADAQSLVETTPSLDGELSADERAVLSRGT